MVETGEGPPRDVSWLLLFPARARPQECWDLLTLSCLLLCKCQSAAASRFMELAGLDGCMLRWVRNWLNGGAQRVVVNGVKSSWLAGHEWCCPGLSFGSSLV